MWLFQKIYVITVIFIGFAIERFCRVCHEKRASRGTKQISETY